MSDSSIARNTTIDSAAQIGAMVLSVLTGIVLARMLGPAGRGTFIEATTLAGAILFSMTNFGIELAASVLVAKDRTRVAQVHTLFVLACVGIAALLALALTLGFDFVREYVVAGIGPGSLIALAIALPFWNYLFGCYGILIGLGRIRTRALFDLGLNLVQNAVVIGVLTARGKDDVEGTVRILVMCFYGIIVAGSLAMHAMLLAKERLWAIPDRSTFRQFYEYGFWVYIGNMGASFTERVDQYFVARPQNDALFGVYSVATSLTARTRVFPQALSRSAYPRICSLPQPEAARLVAACFRQMLALGLLLICGGLLVSPLIPILYGWEFSAAILPFIIFLVGRLFSNCSWMLANYFTGHLARPKIASYVNWGILPLQAVLAFIAMQIGGITAVALVTSGTYFLVFAAFLVLFLRWQDTVGAKELLLLGKQDIAPWKALVGRIFKRS
jgi:O-antigen/teichoic acid export membrane protein